MAVIIYLSGHLKSYAGGKTEIALDAEFADVRNALDSLWQRHPALRDRILNEQGEIRQHVNIFYDGRDIRRMNGLETEIAEDAEIHIFNAVSGG